MVFNGFVNANKTHDEWFFFGLESVMNGFFELMNGFFFDSEPMMNGFFL